MQLPDFLATPLRPLRQCCCRQKSIPILIPVCFRTEGNLDSRLFLELLNSLIVIAPVQSRKLQVSIQTQLNGHPLKRRVAFIANHQFTEYFDNLSLNPRIERIIKGSLPSRGSFCFTPGLSGRIDQFNSRRIAGIIMQHLLQ